MLRRCLLIGVFHGLLAGTGAAASVDPFVVSVQNLLREEGVFPDDSTGVLDARTIAALRHYQILNRLRVTGRLDDPTLAAMRLTPPLPPPEVMAEDRRFLKGLAKPRPGNGRAPELAPATHLGEGTESRAVAEVGIDPDDARLKPVEAENVKSPLNKRHRAPARVESHRTPLRERRQRRF